MEGSRYACLRLQIRRQRIPPNLAWYVYVYVCVYEIMKPSIANSKMSQPGESGQIVKRLLLLNS